MQLKHPATRAPFGIMTLSICLLSSPALSESSIRQNIADEQRIAKCWSAGKNYPSVRSHIWIDKDGNVTDTKLLKPKLSAETSDAVEAARSAIFDCAPYAIVKKYPEHYKIYSEIGINFSPDFIMKPH